MIFVGSFVGSEYLREGEGLGDELIGFEMGLGVFGGGNVCGYNVIE